ncbi:unnamed protein product [Paramecium sonneborni]|uniref:EFHB C-terminal EF-hand domain-containing protein n=1 Tax=Paramecium sonneborni TaxID=65129 RepID=A0A8S1KS78_9CILI|nr:unnamed protein product [Paramecium sonneborni]
MSGKSRDYFGTLKSAGRTVLKEESAGDCIQPVQNQVPETPPHIKKYRKSYKHQHGCAILHPGLVDAPKPQGNWLYGKKTDPSDKAGDLFKQQPEGIKELINEINEQKYASHIKEPLGTMPTRNYNWPEESKSDGFAFGQKIPPSEFTAKEVVFPPDAKRDDESVRLMYLKSHGNFEAGEQKNREYNWNVNPNEFRFGKKDEREQQQMKKILQHELTQNQYPKTTIISKNQEDWKNYNEDPLGKPKNQAQINSRMPTIFGEMKKDEQWTAGQCINGQPTQKEVQPDIDLGKATKFGFRNQPKPGDETRTFGVPTIRNDILKTGMKSVADPQNYGDEVPAVALLFPEKFSHMGLTEQDFLMLRNKKDIKQIFESIGIKYGIGKFEGVFKRAKEIQNTFDDKVSVKAFQLAVQEMHHID